MGKEYIKSVYCKLRLFREHRHFSLLERPGSSVQNSGSGLKSPKQGSWIRIVRPGSCSITHHRVTKQTTQKLQNNYTKEILVLIRKFYDPKHTSQSGGPAKGLRTLREFDFEGQWYLTTDLLQNWGKTLGGHKQSLVHTRTQEKGAVTPQEIKPDLPVRNLKNTRLKKVGGKFI